MHMKKASRKPASDEMRPEYDIRGGVRGKYYERYQQGTNVVLLEPDIADVFQLGRFRPTDVLFVWASGLVPTRTGEEPRLRSPNHERHQRCPVQARLHSYLADTAHNICHGHHPGYRIRASSRGWLVYYSPSSYA